MKEESDNALIIYPIGGIRNEKKKDRTSEKTQAESGGAFSASSKNN